MVKVKTLVPVIRQHDNNSTSTSVNDLSGSSDKSLKVALSVPIWSDKPGVPDRRVLGVLGMSSELKINSGAS